MAGVEKVAKSQKLTERNIYPCNKNQNPCSALLTSSRQISLKHCS